MLKRYIQAGCLASIFVAALIGAAVQTDQKMSGTPQQQRWEDASFNYFGIGVNLPIPIPGMTFGHREKFEGGAVDVATSLATLLIASGVTLEGKYIKYMNKNYYVGIGPELSLVIFPEYVNYGIGPVMTFGSEGEKNLQQIDFTVVCFTPNEIIINPLATYRYGFKF